MSDADRDLEILKAELQKKNLEFQDECSTKQNKSIGHYAYEQAQVAILGSYATLGLRALLTLNGGSAIGLLTFVGNLWAKDSLSGHYLAMKVMSSVRMFVFGIILATFAMLLSYISQAVFLEWYEESRGRLWGNLLRVLAAGVSLASLFAFSNGALSAARALAHTIP